MKKLFYVFGILLIVAVAIAQTATYDLWLTWTPNPPQELVSGYRIEYQKAPVVNAWTYFTWVPSSTNGIVIKNLSPGYVYKFRAFAVNAIGVGTNLSSVVQIPTEIPGSVINFSNKTSL